MAMTNTHYNVADTLREANPDLYKKVGEWIVQWIHHKRTVYRDVPENQRDSGLIMFWFRDFCDLATGETAEWLDKTQHQIAYTWFDTVLFMICNKMIRYKVDKMFGDGDDN